MGATELYIYGASGHGKVVAEIALLWGIRLADLSMTTHPWLVEHFLELPICGGFEWLVRRARQCKLVVGLGIGDNRDRYRVAQHCRELDIVGTLVHPSAIVSPSASIGNGTVMMARVVVNATLKYRRRRNCQYRE